MRAAVYAPTNSRRHTSLQPPLSYYVGVINNRDWARVDVVTYGPEGRDENPVVPALRMLAEMGTWPNIEFNIHPVSTPVGFCMFFEVFILSLIHI